MAHLFTADIAVVEHNIDAACVPASLSLVQISVRDFLLVIPIAGFLSFEPVECCDIVVGLPLPPPSVLPVQRFTAFLLISVTETAALLGTRPNGSIHWTRLW